MCISFPLHPQHRHTEALSSICGMSDQVRESGKKPTAF
jgi:hypothetical protein